MPELKQVTKNASILASSGCDPDVDCPPDDACDPTEGWPPDQE